MKAVLSISYLQPSNKSLSKIKKRYRENEVRKETKIKRFCIRDINKVLNSH